MKPDSRILKWLDKYIVDPLDFKKPLPRLIGVTFLFRSAEHEWGVRVSLPAWRGDWLWRNGLFSFYLHLPFCVSLSIRLPIPHWDRIFGWTFQFCLGWKSYNGRLAATLRFQNDDHEEFNNPTGPSGRAKGLDEGFV